VNVAIATIVGYSCVWIHCVSVWIPTGIVDHSLVAGHTRKGYYTTFTGQVTYPSLIECCALLYNKIFDLNEWHNEYLKLQMMMANACFLTCLEYTIKVFDKPLSIYFIKVLLTEKIICTSIKIKPKWHKCVWWLLSLPFNDQRMVSNCYIPSKCDQVVRVL